MWKATTVIQPYHTGYCKVKLMGFIMTPKSFNANKVHRQKRKSKFTLVAATVDYSLI